MSASSTRTVERAQMLIDLGRPADALAVLGPALVQDPEDGDLLCVAAQAHLVAGDDSRAVELASLASAQQPEEEWPLRLMSIGYSRLGRHREAVEAAYRGVLVEPQLHLTHLQYARALSHLPGPQAHAQAWAEGSRAVELAPDDPAVHQLMADLAHPVSGASSHGLDVAETALRRVLALDPGSSEAINDLGRIHLRRGRSLDAVAGFSDALGADPHNAAALHNVTVVLHRALLPLLWTVLAACVVSGLGSPPEAGAEGRVLQAVVAVALVALDAVAVRRFRRRVRGRPWVFVAQAARTNRPGALLAALLLAASVLVVVGPLLPDPARGVGAVTAFGLAGLAFLGCMTWGSLILLRQWWARRGWSTRVRARHRRGEDPSAGGGDA